MSQTRLLSVLVENKLGVLQRVASMIRRRGFNIKKVLIVGAGSLGQTVAGRIDEHEELGYEIVGFPR